MIIRVSTVRSGTPAAGPAATNMRRPGNGLPPSVPSTTKSAAVKPPPMCCRLVSSGPCGGMGGSEGLHMELEDCTKEELIFYIKKSGLLSERELTIEVLFFRSDKARDDEHQFYLIADGHFSNYIALTHPYEGKPLRDMPIDTAKKAETELKLWEEYNHKSEAAETRWKRIQKQIDAILLI